MQCSFICHYTFVAQDTISEMCELIPLGKPQLHQKNAKIQEKTLTSNYPSYQNSSLMPSWFDAADISIRHSECK